ncbi:hypothetical protein CATYP_07625 [Corynebacterium atypicum]|uniref:SPOR domain-containing protein n=1 Tax=Corynebacterium atypicum TaxID=191610 RepID=A0ABN4DDS3_9CORY|nr:hypothetical protein [Corynebacterium atypicum]AIG64475.1 hypothetical protein CATYP_07625 [Corynebacterium atypicum]
MAHPDSQWYFNPKTKEVTQGQAGPWDDRMGPYATEEEARHALDLAAKRNDAFDEQDEQWEGEK